MAGTMMALFYGVIALLGGLSAVMFIMGMGPKL